MGENWQIEAVKEQFTVLNTSRFLQQQNLDTNNHRDVVRIVKRVLGDHLQPKPPEGNKLLANMAVTIIKQHKGNVKLSFIVIVTDLKVNGRLHKMPVFVIQFGNRKTFIDMQCLSYQTWNDFMKHANKALPQCKFCFPVGGQYRENRILKVNFATTIMQVSHGWWTFAKWGFVAVLAASTVLFNAKPEMLLSQSLKSVAETFISLIDTDFASLVDLLLDLISSARRNPMQLMQDIPRIFEILRRLHNKYKDEIDYMTDKVKETFQKIWDYIRNKLSRKSVPIELLSVASSTNIDYYESNSYRTQIFENCQNENVFHYNAVKKSDVLSHDLAPITEFLLSTSADIVNKYPTMMFPVVGQQKITGNDLPEIFLSVKTLVDNKFEESYAHYNRLVKAVREFAGQSFDIDEFNISIGIHGDPKKHFMMKSMEYINQLPTLPDLVYKKCKELKEQEPVLLIPCMKTPNNEKTGLYRCIGKSKGLVSTTSFVKGLSKIFDTNEENFVEKEENNGKTAKITLIFDNYVANIWQNLNENNDMEGMVIIFESPI